MRRAILTTAAILSSSLAWGQGLVITEIADTTLPGGLPKFVEITNFGTTTVDMTTVSIGNINNGATTMGFDSTPLSGSLAPGDSYVVSYEAGDSPGVGLFFDTYDFDPDNFDPGSFINGDDVVVLFSGPALAGDPGDGTGAPVIDVYGVVGVDGTGQVWEYTDGYARRNPNPTPGPVFDPAEWFFGGANSLETGDDVEERSLINALTSPGYHFAAVPSMGTWALGLLSVAMAGLGTMIVRRKRN